MGLIDERRAPPRHDLVERIGHDAGLPSRWQFGGVSVQQIPTQQLDRVDADTTEVQRLPFGDRRFVSKDGPVEVGIGHRATDVLGAICREREMGSSTEPGPSGGRRLGERELGEPAQRIHRNEGRERPVGRRDRSGGRDVRDQPGPLGGGERCGVCRGGGHAGSPAVASSAGVVEADGVVGCAGGAGEPERLAMTGVLVLSSQA